MVAMPSPARTDPDVTSGQGCSLTPRNPSPITMSAALMTSSAPTFTAVVTFCMLALLRVPTILTPAITTITTIDTSRAVVGASVTNWVRYDVNATASVASDPLLMTKNSAQP